MAAEDDPKPCPLMVKVVPPVTVPYLGLISVTFGVELPSYWTLLVRPA
jgi:hypothetical protein